MLDPRFPVGKYEKRDLLTAAERAALIDAIAATPANMRAAVRHLTDQQLDTPYREGGWTVRQVVHHVPDSHLNAYTRFKLALTEESPVTIRPYEEAKWAELADVAATPIDTSLTLLDALHDRWVRLLRSLGDADFQRRIFHPEYKYEMTLDALLGMYGWHGRHHVAHITTLRESMGW